MRVLIDFPGALLEIFIQSEVCNDPGIIKCGRAIIRVNGVNHSIKTRGYIVVVVNSVTGNVQVP